MCDSFNSIDTHGFYILLFSAQRSEMSSEYRPPPASSSIRPHRCEVCQRSFREIATLRKHEQLHRADRPYICTTCGKSFLWSSNLKVHERVHTGERPYKCKICHRCFTQSNDLRRHERNVHMRSLSKIYKQPAARAQSAGQVSLTPYQQALMTMRQTALLHTMVYDPMMAYGVNVTSSCLPQTPSSVVTSPTTTVADITPPAPKSSMTPDILKTEQITPPSTPALRSPSHLTESGESAGRCMVPLPMPSVIQNPISRTPTSAAQTNSLPAIATMLTPSPLNSSGQQSRTPTSPPLLSPQTYLPPAHRSNQRPFFDDCNTAENGVDLRVQKVISMENTTPDGTSGMESESDEKSEESGKGENSSRPSTPSDVRRRSPQSDAEGDEKRDVTTTTASPSRDYGFYHCNHCDIFFRDFTMFHLHQSLHSPDAANPFYCPSCEKHCQDKVEFTFHLVWHVRYPHTIPNYQPYQPYLMCQS